MKTRFTLRVVTAAMVLLLPADEVLAVASGPTAEAIDWPAFMGQHDMTFDKLPRGWTEAPHFGNAMLGSMLYRADDTIRLQVFRADDQDHRDDTWGWTAYSRPRLQIGYFSLHPVGKLTGCHWRKNLWNAELTGTITTDRGEIRIRHFTHAVDMAIVTELTPTAGEKGCNWTWHPAEARTTRGGYPTKESEIAGFARQYGGHYAGTLKVFKANPAGRLETDGGVSVWIQDLLAGGQYATAWGEQVRSDTRTHIVSIANSYPETTAAETAVSDVKRFLALDPAGWVQRHRDWWHAYYPRSFVTLPDKSLESLYWQTIYRYGCTTRAGRCCVDTPGIWFQGKSWPYFTTDWNIQSAHWAVYAANRLEQGQALVERLYDRQEELIKAVRPVEWQEDSAYLPIAVAWDMRGSREGDRRYYDLVGDLPWAMNNCWSQYRYSMDKAMLREKIYPMLRRAINLYLHMVQEGNDGKLHLPPTYSPETSVCADCNFDLALFKWGCLTLLRASQRLSIADPLIPRWREVVIFTSDNGPETTSVIHMRADYGHDGARPWRGMKRDDWDGGHRVPFLVRWPGKVKPGTTSTQLTSLTDVMATVAAIIGTNLPNDAAEDSFNLLPALLGEDRGPIRPYLLQQAFGGPRTLSIRRGNWKYLDHTGSGGNNYEKNPELKPYMLPDTAPGAPGQLYDLAADPGETKNLYFERLEIVKELKALLDQSKASGRSRPQRPVSNP